MLEVSKGSKSLRMKINELVTSLDDINLLEVGGYNVVNDTVAKLKKAYPNWQLGMPHPESNEPTMTKNDMIRFGITKGRDIDPEADPRYFGADGQERKAANKRAKDKYQDRPDIGFTKSPQNYLSPAEWDYKYSRTHNPDGSPKTIRTKDTTNNPSALKNKLFKTKGGAGRKTLNSGDVKDLDKQIILFQTRGEFDTFSGIGSKEDTPIAELQKAYAEDPDNIQSFMAGKGRNQKHTVYGFVDSYRDKDIKVIDDTGFNPIKFTGSANDTKGIIGQEKPDPKKLTPGVDDLPGSTGLASDYKNKITDYYKKLHNFYAPYNKIVSQDFEDSQRKLINKKINSAQAFKKYIDSQGIKGSDEFTGRMMNRDDDVAKNSNPNYTPDNPYGVGIDRKLFDFMNLEHWEDLQFGSNVKMNREILKDIFGLPRVPETKNQVLSILRTLKSLGYDKGKQGKNMPKFSSRPSDLNKDVKFITREFSDSGVSESVIRQALREVEEPIRVDLEDLTLLNPDIVQIVNPEFAKQEPVIPRPEETPGKKGAPAQLKKGRGVTFDQFTNETKENFKKMYGDINNPKVGVSENEPGHKPNSNKSAKNRFYAVVSQDGVLYVQDGEDKKFYPSDNDLLYARAIERLYNMQVIDPAQSIWKGAQTTGELLKRLWKGGKEAITKRFGKDKPYDPGKTSRDYFDK